MATHGDKVMANRPCPKLCGECDASQPHHWMEDASTLTGFACKHCQSVAVECMACGGDGEDLGEDDEGFFVEDACSCCGGAGIVEVVPVTLEEVTRLKVSRAELLAACQSILDDLDGDSILIVSINAVEKVRAAIAKAEKGASDGR